MRIKKINPLLPIFAPVKSLRACGDQGYFAQHSGSTPTVDMRRTERRTCGILSGVLLSYDCSFFLFLFLTLFCPTTETPEEHAKAHGPFRAPHRL